MVEILGLSFYAYHVHVQACQAIQSDALEQERLGQSCREEERQEKWQHPRQGRQQDARHEENKARDQC